MKVTDKNHPAATEGTRTHGTKNKHATSKSSDVSGKSSLEDIGSAKVKLSERAQDIKKIRAAVDSTPDVDEAKVAKFKSLIASGNYKVDSSKVADKMVDEHMKNDIFSGGEE
jgi:negative regulator of flagellin synthesis FlgM